MKIRLDSFDAEELLARVFCFIERSRESFRGVMDYLAKRYNVVKQALPMLNALGLSVLRNYLLLDYIVDTVCGLRVEKYNCFRRWLIRILVYEYVFRNIGFGRIERFLSKAKITRRCLENTKMFNYEKELSRLGLVDKLSIRYSIPRWIVDYIWKNKLVRDEGELEKLIRALHGPQPTWIRVNLLKISKKRLRDLLESKGVVVEEDPLLPDMMLVVKGKEKLTRLKEYRDGFFVFQNRATALVAHVLNPKRGELVYDLCSAPGGKAFHIASLTRCKSYVVGIDISNRRLETMSELSEKLGAINCVDPLGGDILRGPVVRKAKYIVLDPDCTSIGRIGHSPEIRLWITPVDIARMARLQRQLLYKTIELGAPGARIVYSTCTITLEENEENIKAVLESYPGLRLVEPNISLGKPGIGLEKTRRLYPHLHKSIGFYLALLELEK